MLRNLKRGNCTEDFEDEVVWWTRLFGGRTFINSTYIGWDIGCETICYFFWYCGDGFILDHMSVGNENKEVTKNCHRLNGRLLKLIAGGSRNSQRTVRSLSLKVKDAKVI